MMPILKAVVFKAEWKMRLIKNSILKHEPISIQPEQKIKLYCHREVHETTLHVLIIYLTVGRLFE